MNDMELPLLCITLLGPAQTRGTGSAGSTRTTRYRRAIERAVAASTHRREIPSTGALAVRIAVTRHPGRRGDADNLAKPILDALQEVFGVDQHGRADDHRVRQLQVLIKETQSGLEFVTIEVFKMGSTLAVA